MPSTGAADDAGFEIRVYRGRPVTLVGASVAAITDPDAIHASAAIPTSATCLPAASIAARQAARSDFPVIIPTASAANTVSPAPQTSRTSVGVAGRCQVAPMSSAPTIPQWPRVMTTWRRWASASFRGRASGRGCSQDVVSATSA